MPTLPTRGLRVSALTDWMTAQGVVTAIERGRPGDQLSSQPDQLVVVYLTGGPGLAVERLFDTLTCQVRVRGPQGDEDAAEALAWQVDGVFVDAEVPVHMGSTYVNDITRVGGPPTFDRRDSARRVHYTCNYLLSVARF